jgi:hypothetical protein
MRSFVSLVIVCSALNLFALQISKPINLETASAVTATQPALPAITFSSVGPISSVQMTGTVNWTYGSDQQTGTVTLQATANGQSRILLQLPSGSRSEVQNPFSDSQRQCTWSGADAVVHSSAVHHCWVDAIWFLPGITMQTGAGALDDVASVVQLSDASKIRIHRERHLVDVDSAQTGQFVAHLSAVDLDIDSATSLPVMLAFAIHPDNDAGIDMPVEIRYSAYSIFSGVTVPTHIQKFINHALVLDMQITAVQVQLATPIVVASTSTPLN